MRGNENAWKRRKMINQIVAKWLKKEKLHGKMLENGTWAMWFLEGMEEMMVLSISLQQKLTAFVLFCGPLWASYGHVWKVTILESLCFPTKNPAFWFKNFGDRCFWGTTPYPTDFLWLAQTHLHPFWSHRAKLIPIDHGLSLPDRLEVPLSLGGWGIGRDGRCECNLWIYFWKIYI